MSSGIPWGGVAITLAANGIGSKAIYDMSIKLPARFDRAELIPIPSNGHATIVRDIPDDVWKRVYAFITE